MRCKRMGVAAHRDLLQPVGRAIGGKRSGESVIPEDRSWRGIGWEFVVTHVPPHRSRDDEHLEEAHVAGQVRQPVGVRVAPPAADPAVVRAPAKSLHVSSPTELMGQEVCVVVPRGPGRIGEAARRDVIHLRVRDRHRRVRSDVDQIGAQPAPVRPVVFPVVARLFEPVELVSGVVPKKRGVGIRQRPCHLDCHRAEVARFLSRCIPCPRQPGVVREIVESVGSHRGGLHPGIKLPRLPVITGNAQVALSTVNHHADRGHASQHPQRPDYDLGLSGEIVGAGLGGNDLREGGICPVGPSVGGGIDKQSRRIGHEEATAHVRRPISL